MIAPESMAAQCAPPKSPPWFSSLADITRVGAEFVKNPNSMDAVERVQEYRTFRMNCLTTTLSMLDSAKLPRHALVSVRLKRLDSIRRKIRRTESNFKLGGLDDIVGVRVVLPTFQNAIATSKRIQKVLPCKNPKDYTAEPRQTGYRAVHHIVFFEQALSAEQSLNVRFEIQVRSFYQHRWAIWSESKGEAVKAGSGDEDDHSELRALSKRIARWEESNPKVKQAQLPAYVDNKNIAVVWRKRNFEPLFYDDMNNAIEFLNYLETTFSAERENALLLVGVSNPAEVQQVLRQTHPLYMQSSVTAPEHWMPPGS